jgi:hypothetical protein
MNTPAFPSARALATASGVMTEGHAGLTKRELAALIAMHGLMTMHGVKVGDENMLIPNHADIVAGIACQMADSMLKALEGGAQ